ncbi:Uncharacterised protein [Serratia plymuthica]|uniref:Uncharacterized protein n=1 Tax=Serratia plymuthica TaxID=82996 RepID=A0A2X4UZI6_SERPL|nr:Uncharacterised protein [Serratia plymuthica]
MPGSQTTRQIGLCGSNLFRRSAMLSHILTQSRGSLTRTHHPWRQAKLVIVLGGILTRLPASYRTRRITARQTAGQTTCKRSQCRNRLALLFTHFAEITGAEHGLGNRFGTQCRSRSTAAPAAADLPCNSASAPATTACAMTRLSSFGARRCICSARYGAAPPAIAAFRSPPASLAPQRPPPAYPAAPYRPCHNPIR